MLEAMKTAELGDPTHLQPLIGRFLIVCTWHAGSVLCKNADGTYRCEVPDPNKVNEAYLLEGAEEESAAP